MNKTKKIEYYYEGKHYKFEYPSIISGFEVEIFPIETGFQDGKKESIFIKIRLVKLLPDHTTLNIDRFFMSPRQQTELDFKLELTVQTGINCSRDEI